MGGDSLKGNRVLVSELDSAKTLQDEHAAVSDNLKLIEQSDLNSPPLSVLFAKPKKHLRLLCQKFSDYESSSAIVVVINSDGEVCYINQMGCDVVATDKESLTGECWLTKVIPEWQRADVLFTFDCLMQGNPYASLEYFHDLHTFDGLDLPYKWQNCLIKNADDKVIGTFCWGVDIRSLSDKLESFSYDKIG